MRKPFLYLLALTAIIVFNSCSKDDDPVTPPAKTIEELLSLNTWKLDEYRFVQNNAITYYKRGTTPNGIVYDADSIKLRSDFSGIYYNSAGNGNITWSFVDAEKTKIKLNLPNNFTVNWENMFVTETTLYYTEYFVIPNTITNSVGAAHRTKR